ncbi:MAG: SMI1/KNR4 family protein [Bacteroidales bacterium]|nr:SMI1/KNR4 family protein [Bacteroidales bacterium]
MDFSFLKKYKVEIHSEQRNKQKHSFHTIDSETVKEVELYIQIPKDLKEFWKQIGYGFMFNDSYSIDRFLDPLEYKRINLGLEYYEFDPDSEFFRENYDRSIFFEVNEGVLLTIDKKTEEIYYFDEKIANSLLDFLKRFDSEGHYFEKK